MRRTPLQAYFTAKQDLKKKLGMAALYLLFLLACCGEILTLRMFSPFRQQKAVTFNTDKFVTDLDSNNDHVIQEEETVDPRQATQPGVPGCMDMTAWLEACTGHYGQSVAAGYAMFDLLDLDRSGRLNKRDFMHRAIDSDNDGRVTVCELQDHVTMVARLAEEYLPLMQAQADALRRTLHNQIAFRFPESFLDLLGLARHKPDCAEHTSPENNQPAGEKSSIFEAHTNIPSNKPSSFLGWRDENVRQNDPESDDDRYPFSDDGNDAKGGYWEEEVPCEEEGGEGDAEEDGTHHSFPVQKGQKDAESDHSNPVSNISCDEDSSHNDSSATSNNSSSSRRGSLGNDDSSNVPVTSSHNRELFSPTSTDTSTDDPASDKGRSSTAQFAPGADDTSVQPELGTEDSGRGGNQQTQHSSPLPQTTEDVRDGFNSSDLDDLVVSGIFKFQG